MVKIYPNDHKAVARMQATVQVHTNGGSLELASMDLSEGKSQVAISLSSREGNICYLLDLDEFCAAVEALKAGVEIPNVEYVEDPELTEEYFEGETAEDIGFGSSE